MVINMQMVVFLGVIFYHYNLIIINTFGTLDLGLLISFNILTVLGCTSPRRG